MTITVEQFRTDFPEFADDTAYPDSGVTYWLNLAGLLLNTQRWSTLLDVGTELFTAHNLVLERKAQTEASIGAPPGVTTGPVSNKSAHDVSISYDTQAGVEAGAGHWNNTVYGTRFIRLVKMVGAGPVQVGAGGCAGPLSSANAWSGPYCGPGWFGS